MDSYKPENFRLKPVAGSQLKRERMKKLLALIVIALFSLCFLSQALGMDVLKKLMEFLWVKTPIGRWMS